MSGSGPDAARDSWSTTRAQRVVTATLLAAISAAVFADVIRRESWWEILSAILISGVLSVLWTAFMIRPYVRIENERVLVRNPVGPVRQFARGDLARVSSEYFGVAFYGASGDRLITATAVTKSNWMRMTKRRTRADDVVTQLNLWMGKQSTH